LSAAGHGELADGFEISNQRYITQQNREEKTNADLKHGESDLSSMQELSFSNLPTLVQTDGVV
jgi:hypothetical protein